MSCPSGEQLCDFLEETLEEALRDSIEKHAENCSACQERLAQLSEVNFPAPARERPEYAPNEAFLRRLKEARPESISRLLALKQILSDADARYATPGDLADDLRRFVEGRPIATRPIGRVGRLPRWARRNPVTAALTGAVLALLLGVAVGSSVTAVYLQGRLTESEGSRRRAEDADRAARQKDAQDKNAQDKKATQ
jgi:hypothetical protein